MANTLRSLSVKKNTLTVAIAATVALTSNTYAQDAELEQITVTGSRIRITSGMNTPVPVTAVTPDELTNFDPGGTMVEQLDKLPQFFQSFTSQRGSSTLHGEGGASYLNMRNLGINRTLILLDGSRIPPADKRGAVNVDILPSALMQTVDVVTGGASAAYGADALGGVVNFVLDREYEGLSVNVGTGMNEWGDGQRWNFGVAGGTAIGDRLNVIGSVNGTEISQINRAATDVTGEGADWYQNFGMIANPEWVAGNNNAPRRIVVPCVMPIQFHHSGMIWSRENYDYSSNAARTSFKYNGMVFTDDGTDVRNFAYAPLHSPPEQRGSTNNMAGCGNPEYQDYMRTRDAISGNEVVNRSGFAAAQYQFSDNLSGYVQAMVGRSESRSNNFHRGGITFTGNWHGRIFRDNAFLPEHVGEAMDEAGIESFHVMKPSTSYAGLDYLPGRKESWGVFVTRSYATGFDANLPNGWNLTGNVQSGLTTRTTGETPDHRADRTALALDAVRHPDTGQIVCRVQLFNPTAEELAASVSDRLASPGGLPGGTVGSPTTEPLASPVGTDRSIEDCVPLNIFGVATTTRAAGEYLYTPKSSRGEVEQDFAELILTGDVYEGWGYGPVSFAAGLNWRQQSFFDHARPTFIDELGPPTNAPEIGIRGIPPGYTTGSANLHSTSTVPNLVGDYDVVEYFGELIVPFWESNSGSQILNGSIAARRSDYNTLDNPVDSWKVGLDFQVTEGLRLRATKSRDIREAAFFEKFDAQSTSADICDPIFENACYTTTQTRGGNPELEPEKADTNVIGFVYQPTWFPGLGFSTDWYDVQVKDSISELGAQRIIDECYNNDAQQLCSQILRDGQIGRIFNTYLNVASARVRGLDYEVTYNMEPNFFANQFESLTVRALAGYIQERSDTPFGGSPRDAAGELEQAKTKATINVNYGVGPLSFNVQQRYVESTILDIDWQEGVDVDDNTIASGNTTNLQMRYEGVVASGATWNLSLNITNLFNRHPPIVPGTSNQSIPFDYDVYGRRYFVSASYDF